MKNMSLYYIVKEISEDEVRYILGPFGDYREAVQGKANLALTRLTTEYTIYEHKLQVEK